MIQIEQLKKLLTLPLPGEKAQWKMAPKGRLSAVEADYRNFKKAAVLIPLFEKNSLLHVVLTLRSVYDGVHSAQVSFPGGKFEEGETEPYLVAIRELEEELGIDAEYIEIIGSLSPLIIPVSSMLVYPVVAWMKQPSKYKPDSREVQKVIESPLDLFRREFVKSSKSIIGNFDKPLEVPYFEIEQEKVWGATAMMISELMDIVEDWVAIDSGSSKQI